ncbi:hypothetical protein HanRHA438_Chr01g0015251 [Helianthus annuus]|nr:hypothetical protein HanIR_Chr01g0016611 [Helianthus annuus]KAJ0947441.1 hypothetical protein HanRHA438_Chr01g0015251 [Helianthus annuus]
MNEYIWDLYLQVDLNETEVIYILAGQSGWSCQGKTDSLTLQPVWMVMSRYNWFSHIATGCFVGTTFAGSTITPKLFRLQLSFFVLLSKS